MILGGFSSAGELWPWTVSLDGWDELTALDRAAEFKPAREDVQFTLSPEFGEL